MLAIFYQADAPDGEDESESAVSLGDVGRLALAVALPIVVLVVLASLILVIMRSCHNKRMRELNRKWPGLSWLYGGGKQNTFEKLYLNFALY